VEASLAARERSAGIGRPADKLEQPARFPVPTRASRGLATMVESKWLPLAAAAVLVEDSNWRWRQEIRRALMLGKIKARGVIPPGVRSEIPPEGELVMISADKFVGLEFQFGHSRLCYDRHFRVAAYEAVEVRRATAERHAKKWSECENGAAENAHAVANTIFEGPRWPIYPALGWIARREIEGLTLTPEGLRSLRYRGVMRKDVGALVVKDPVGDLLTALRAGKLKAIGHDHKEFPLEYWDTKTTDLRTWPEVRFRRGELLRLWPDVRIIAEEEGSQESGERLQGGLPQCEAIKTDSSKPRMSDRDVEKKLASFLKQLKAERELQGRRFNQESARQAAEEHFGNVIDRTRFRPLYRSAGLNQKGGRPRKTSQKS
jgi:hypothetical protein